MGWREREREERGQGKMEDGETVRWEGGEKGGRDRDKQRKKGRKEEELEK